MNRTVYHIVARAADKRPWVSKISLIVDKETGLVLEKTEYNKNNEACLSNKVVNLQLNQNIDSNIFQIDYDKYKINKKIVEMSSVIHRTHLVFH